METARRTLGLCVALCLAIALKAQVVESGLSFRRYTTQDGLPQMQTEKIFQDARGYIYVGTLSGFVRFDGRTFTPFLTGHRWNIVQFMETAEGVSALSFRQQWLIDGDRLTLRPLDPEDRWLLNNFNAADLPAGYALFEDEQEQHRWVGKAAKGHAFTRVDNDKRLDQMSPDRHLYIDSVRGLLIPTDSIYCYHRQGGTLYAFGDGGIYTVQADGGLLLRTPFGEWRPDYGLLVRPAKDGTLLIADSHSLYSYDGQTVRRLAGGFNLIKDIFTDRWDRLWVATYQGLYCFFNRHFTNYRLADRDDIVRAVALKVWGTLNGKVISQGRVVYDNPDDFFLPCAAVIDSCVYMAGRSDVACISGDKVNWLHLPYDRYQFVCEAGGRLIVGMRQLVVSYDPQTGRADTLTTDVAHPWCAAQDARGRLWVGSTFGLYCLSPRQGGKSGGWTTEKVACGDHRLIVSAMEADRRGTVFFASVDSLFMIRDGKVSELNDQLPLLNGHEVRSLHVSPKGFLVVATLDGLLLCRISDDYRLSDACFYNHLNGFTLIEPLQATMAEAADGTVYVCALEGMASFQPAELIRDAQTDTFIAPPLRWWQHWWVWLAGVLLLAWAVWAVTRLHEKRRSRRRMIRLQREKLLREEQLEAIRQKAMKAATTKLGKDIVRMTETGCDERVTLRTASGTIVINVKDIAYFKGDGNYSQIVTFHDKDTVLVGLGALEAMLNPNVFVRADRSTLVNIHHISSLLPKQRRCLFRSSDGRVVETSLLAPAFKRLQGLV
ncbi:MAG: LytTR family transcriptional regulator DNA-binding domain-containing protein [Prevotella sp.]|nr:LytTR family transcriptional regulator DNA-binding domain-containing protein [Prevotella sp.]